VDLLGIVQGAVKANPSSLYLRVVKSGTWVEKDIKLESRSGKMVIQSIEVPNADNFQFQQSIQGDNMIVHLKWLAGSRLETVYNTIQIRFSSPEKGSLHIPVIGFVDKP
jgi:hypothetical protein